MHFAPSAPSKVKDKSYELHIQFFTVHSIVPMVIFLVFFFDVARRSWIELKDLGLPHLQQFIG